MKAPDELVGHGKWVKRWVVPSSSGGDDHIVAQAEDGSYACDCLGWTRHTPRTDCRHIRDIKEGLYAESIMTEGQRETKSVLDRLAGYKISPRSFLRP